MDDALDLSFFTGRPYDHETGFYYYRARDYDPGTQRFISQDPSGFGGGDANLHRYVGNSPQNATDPTGEFAISGTILAGLTIKAVIAYFATQAAFAAVETGVEYYATDALGSDEDLAQFSVLNTFGKNFGINVITGGIGGKGKLVATTTRLVGMYALRQSIEIGGDTAYDVFANDRGFGSALLTNTAGSLLGEGVGRVVGAGLRKAGRGIRNNFEFVDVGGSSVYTSMSGLGRLTDLRVRMRGPVRPSHFADSADGIRLFKEAGAYRRRLPGSPASKQYRNIVVADVTVDGVRRTRRFLNTPEIKGKQLGVHSEERLIKWHDILTRQQGRAVEIHSVFSERIPCGTNRANCIGKLGEAFGQDLDVFFNVFKGGIR